MMPPCARCGRKLETVNNWIRLGPHGSSRLRRYNVCDPCAEFIESIVVTERRQRLPLAGAPLDDR